MGTAKKEGFLSAACRSLKSLPMPTWEPRDPRARTAAQYRRQIIARSAFAAGILFVLASFGGGYLWQTSHLEKAASPAEESPATAPARAEALAAIDEAVRAKYEGRKEGALTAIDRARRAGADPSCLALIFAELALDNQEFDAMRSAANQTVRQGDRSAQARVLLGVHQWLTRGGSPDDMSKAADEASVSFADATDEEPFLAPAYFFRGDVLRYSGRQSEGYAQTLAALHRFAPWTSADVITAKLALASREAGDRFLVGLAFLQDSPLLRTMTAHISADKNVSELPAAITAQTSQAVVRSLAADGALQAVATDSSPNDSRSQP